MVDMRIFHTAKDLTTENLDVYEEFKKQFDQRLMFTSPYDPDEAPIITLTESVSSWNIGDDIVIGNSSNRIWVFYRMRHWERLTLCTVNSLKISTFEF